MIPVIPVKFIAIFCIAINYMLAPPKSNGQLGNNKPPNLVIIISDDQGHDDFGALNPKIFNTP